METQSSFLNKTKLIEDVMASFRNNKHILPEGAAVHDQEHKHLLSIIHKAPAEKMMPLSEVIELVATIFNEIEAMTETIEYKDVEFGHWTETCVELDIDQINDMREKYLTPLYKDT